PPSPTLLYTLSLHDALPISVEKLTPMSEAREGRNYFRVEAQLGHTPEWLRPGMEGVGKIEIGRRLLIWIWTHQAIDWIRLTLWKDRKSTRLNSSHDQISYAV